MEKELAYLHSVDDRHYSRRPPSDYGYERRDRRDQSPPSRGYGSSNRGREYNHRDSRDQNYYDRPSPPQFSPPPKTGGYRDSVSYPMQKRQSGYDSRDSSRYGNSGGGDFSVGYGGGAGGRAGKSGSDGAPPGWPNTGFNKSSTNQRPFSNSGPWN